MELSRAPHARGRTGGICRHSSAISLAISARRDGPFDNPRYAIAILVSVHMSWVFTHGPYEYAIFLQLHGEVTRCTLQCERVYKYLYVYTHKYIYVHFWINQTFHLPWHDCMYACIFLLCRAYSRRSAKREVRWVFARGGMTIRLFIFHPLKSWS